jgi:hypothetical protein
MRQPPARGYLPAPAGKDAAAGGQQYPRRDARLRKQVKQAFQAGLTDLYLIRYNVSYKVHMTGDLKRIPAAFYRSNIWRGARAGLAEIPVVCRSAHRRL